MVHCVSDGKDQCRSSGGVGSLSSPSPSRRDHDVTGGGGSESSLNSFSRTRAGQFQRLLLLRKRYHEDTECVERLHEMDCFGWGPGITK